MDALDASESDLRMYVTKKLEDYYGLVDSKLIDCIGKDFPPAKRNFQVVHSSLENVSEANKRSVKIIRDKLTEFINKFADVSFLPTPIKVALENPLDINLNELSESCHYMLSLYGQSSSEGRLNLKIMIRTIKREFCRLQTRVKHNVTGPDRFLCQKSSPECKPDLCLVESYRFSSLTPSIETYISQMYSDKLVVVNADPLSLIMYSCEVKARNMNTSSTIALCDKFIKENVDFKEYPCLISKSRQVFSV